MDTDESAGPICRPQPLPAELRIDLLRKLIEAEQFEQFLHKNTSGKSVFRLRLRNSYPMLDHWLREPLPRGVDEIYMGMATAGV